MDQRGKRLFLCIGLPLLILNFLIGFLGMIMGILITIFDFTSFYLLILWGRKNITYVRWFKLSILLFSMQMSYMFYSISNPLLWGQELRTGIDRSHLITPQDENIIILKEQFEKWLESAPNASDLRYVLWLHDGFRKYEIYASYRYNLTEINWDSLTDIGKLMVVDYYVQNIAMEYQYDIDIYGYQDFKATPNEILQPWIDSGFTEPAQDDCDGSAVVTVSLLKNLGYDAYIGSGKGHWFTVVRLPNHENEIFLNTWQSIRTYAYFNENQVHITQSPFLSFLNILLWGKENTDFVNYMNILKLGYYSVGFIASCIAAILICLLLKNPHSYVDSIGLESDEDDRKNRIEKLSRRSFRKQKFNPLNWIIDRTYIRVGNPFRKRFIAEWSNIAFAAGIIFVSIVFLGSLPNALEAYTNIYILTVAYLGCRIIDADIIPFKVLKLKEK